MSASTMAKSFSAALDDMFKMDNSIADLDAAVAEKYVQLRVSKLLQHIYNSTESTRWYRKPPN